MSINAGNAVIAKARALYGKRITLEQYQDMINCRTVNEVASYLKNSTNYQTALSNISETNIHRGQLETIIRREAFNVYTKMYHYLNTTEENLFHYITMEFEMREILRMVLLLKAGDPENFIIELPGYLIEKVHIDLVALAEVRSFDELIRVLGDTHYAEILKRLKPTPENPKIDYIKCEHELYTYYFGRLFQMINKNARGTERLELRRLMGMRLDQLNTRIIVRSKVHFNGQPKNIAQRIFPFHRKLTPEKIDEWLHAPNTDQLIKLVKESATAIGLDKKLAGNENDFIESYTERLQYQVCANYLHLSTNISVVFYSYFILSQIETKNIINIIEGIRYQIPKEEIQKLLVL